MSEDAERLLEVLEEISAVSIRILNTLTNVMALVIVLVILAVIAAALAAG